MNGFAIKKFIAKKKEEGSEIIAWTRVVCLLEIVLDKIQAPANKFSLVLLSSFYYLLFYVCSAAVVSNKTAIIYLKSQTSFVFLCGNQAQACNQPENNNDNWISNCDDYVGTRTNRANEHSVFAYFRFHMNEPWRWNCVVSSCISLSTSQAYKVNRKTLA